MKSRTLLKSVFLLVVLSFAGCETYDVQTTSGTDYISRYPTGDQAERTPDLDKQVREIANVEPTLRFPARIGLAKLYNGRIVNLTPEEVEGWTTAKQALGSGFGEFIPVSALVAESVYSSPNPINPDNRAGELLKKVRLGAARQHLDAVLIYEVFSETKKTSLASSVSDWTIIGAYLIPSKEIETTGYANALLLDVRNGYPYGTASASLSRTELAATFNSLDKRQNMEAVNQVATTLKLIPEVEKMMQELMAELGNQ